MFSRRLIYTMILAVAALTVGSVVIIWTMRARSYEYDVRQDYYYNLQDTQANISDIKLVDRRLVLPTGKNNNHHSIFLRINLRSKLTGKFFQPRLVLKSEKLSLTQYFEHGASGVRFINISQLLPEAENILLEWKHLRIKNENIQLISFKNDTLKDKKILVISPHPDDAEIAAFGLYSTYNDSYIITLTAGDAGEYLAGIRFDDGGFLRSDLLPGSAQMPGMVQTHRGQHCYPRIHHICGIPAPPHPNFQNNSPCREENRPSSR